MRISHRKDIKKYFFAVVVVQSAFFFVYNGVKIFSLDHNYKSESTPRARTSTIAKIPDKRNSSILYPNFYFYLKKFDRNYSHRTLTEIFLDQNYQISGTNSSSFLLVENRSSETGVNLSVDVKGREILGEKRRVKIGLPPHVTFVPDTKETGPGIKRYLRAYQAECEKATGADHCLCVPPTLRGRMLLNETRAQLYTWSEVSVISGAGLEAGGVWRPPDCRPVRSLLVLVPYRAREPHLRAFLSHIHPVLQRQRVEYRILVVEQRRPAVFNKASVMNAGFKEAVTRGWHFDCLVLHDVDQLTEDDRNFLTCGPKVKHYGRYLSKFNYKADGRLVFGGIVAFTPAQFTRINGYSNRFFGWGGEDDNAYQRVIKSGLRIQRVEEAVGRYTTLSHEPDPGNQRIDRAWADIWTATLDEGLSSVNYSVVSVTYPPLYTHILLDINEPMPRFKRNTTTHFTLLSTTDCPQTETIRVIGKETNRNLLDLCKDECALDINCTAFVVDVTNTTNCRLKQDGCLKNMKPSNQSHVYLRGIDLKLRNLTRVYDVYEVDCRGWDIVNIRVKDVYECAMSCHRRSDCGGFVQGANKICYMKKLCQPKVGDKYVKSYSKKLEKP